jgi:hypothetical protein
VTLSLLACALLWASPAATEDERPDAGELRACVAAAEGSAGVAACEADAQTRLRERIETWRRAIRARLDNRERQAFDQSEAAWKTWFDAETALIELTLQQRRDGLGPMLQSGAVTRLFEERERQLREHLHNLTFAGGR